MTISLLPLPIYSYMLPTLSMRALSILIMVVLNGLLIPKFLLCLVLMLALSLQIVGFFLPFSIPCYFFLTARRDVWGKSHCYKQAFGNVVIRRFGEGVEC